MRRDRDGRRGRPRKPEREDIPRDELPKARVAAHRKRAAAAGIVRWEIRLPRALVEAVQAFANRNGLSRNEAVARLLRRALKEEGGDGNEDER